MPSVSKAMPQNYFNNGINSDFSEMVEHISNGITEMLCAPDAKV